MENAIVQETTEYAGNNKLNLQTYTGQGIAATQPYNATHICNK